MKRALVVEITVYDFVLNLQRQTSFDAVATGGIRA